MTSRRPMTRTYSGSGRTSSFSEEEGSSSNGRSESRNPYLSNVRPENSYSRYSHYRPPRSTLCSVMAQLTEDIQPSFETTLKSKAVSENCNVKFSCVVSGYPAPELKWYKDDMEMDRYCGLPKYEIHRNGKTHTLHIYKCTLDDAAIYQVSASNSKGIVSCSGVLEVGTMNEYKIHQRFFEKLKQKAEKKKSELEENTKNGGKENIEKEKLQSSPERPPRKRHVPPLERKPAVKEPEAEQLGAAAEPNGPVTSQVSEKKISPPEETLAKKKLKITNGVDAEVNNSSSSKGSCSRTNMMGIGGENCYDGGIGLAQFLAETLQSQAVEEKQSSSKGETPKEMDITTVRVSKEREIVQTLREEQEKEEDYVREKKRAEELATERDKEKERLLEMSHTVPNTKHGSHAKHHNKVHKDHDHHNIQTSLTSVLHSVKDFFFGKSKKDSHDHVENKERELDPYPVSTPPSFRLQPEQNQVCKSLKEDFVPMEIDQPKQPSKTVDIEQQSTSLKPHEHKHEDIVQHTVHPPEHKLPPESIDLPRGESVNAHDSPMEVMEVSVGQKIIGPGEEMSLSGLQVLTEADEKDSRIVSAIKEDFVHQQEPEHLVVSPQPYHHASRDEPSPKDETSILLQTNAPYGEEHSPTPTPTSLGKSCTPPSNLISVSNSQSLGKASCKTLREEKTSSAKMDKEPDSEEDPSSDKSSLIPKVGDYVPSFSNVAEDNTVPEVLKVKPLKEAKIENTVSVEDLQRNRPTVERLCFKPPTHPSLSPASLRKFMSRASQDSDILTNDKIDEDLSGGSTPTSSLSCESSPRLKRRDSLSLIRSATPEELASGARRKIFMPKPKEDGEGAVVGALDTQGKKETPYMSPSQARRAALLQAPTGQNTPPMERRSPLLSRRKATLEVPKVVEETPTVDPVSNKSEEKPAEKKLDPLKAPQVIRKIRGEPFPDASGHLKLWCQFFNVLSDSTIKWYRDEEEILEVKRSGGDESQVALAVVLASSHDCGVYGCTINNEYGTDTTDFLLSEDILSEILLKDDLEVGEEIEMTPLLFSKGLADCGSWGEKYFGRIMTETAQIGEGCSHKTSKVKVIYGLDPVFESGSACIIKVQSPIAYGNTQENNLADKNLQITKQEIKVQNMMREYCKIFAAEARLIENFGFSLEVIPQYLMYRPANSVPYAKLEADLKGEFLKYCRMDPKGRLITQTGSEVEQKGSTFQHWIHQWTHGNLLVTRLEGVETKITNVGVVTKSKGYQGLTEQGSPEVFEQFLTHHQCNYYCGLLGLRSLKSIDCHSTKIKGSRSPLLNRKLGSNSPQLQRKGNSPQLSRKPSPKVTRKVQETEDSKSGAKPKPAVTVDLLEVSSFQYMLVNAKQ
ncbi:hypothetical protein PBY51_011908 [Eleginops maclovinus]|uniref:non-specific serine/threonine protein kinase n=1 Tax=Eleginops maclovinus TaxID=56733 RepID=A0AAN7XU11_ELEMC|nr:hypothetical protein PBY51_011908 [Eleginops maclovinus]